MKTVAIRTIRLCICLLTMTAALVLSATAAPAYEVWITDQSDTGKESGGFLYVYDGAQLAGNPAGAKPTVTVDFAGDIGKVLRGGDQEARAPAAHVIFQRPAGPCHHLVPERTRAVS